MPARITDPVTSHAGDRDVAPRRLSQRERLLEAYRIAGRSGLTDEEAAESAGLPARSCWWKRCSELRETGQIIDTGRVRVGSLGSDRMVCRLNDGTLWANLPSEDEG